MINSVSDNFSVFLIKKCFLHLQVLLFFQTKEKENHTASQMTGHRDPGELLTCSYAVS